ncbi:hypothetical protein GCM10010519_09640 [Streptomyces lactacystinicus]
MLEQHEAGTGVAQLLVGRGNGGHALLIQLVQRLEVTHRAPNPVPCSSRSTGFSSCPARRAPPEFPRPAPVLRTSRPRAPRGASYGSPGGSPDGLGRALRTMIAPGRRLPGQGPAGGRSAGHANGPRGHSRAAK